MMSETAEFLSRGLLALIIGGTGVGYLVRPRYFADVPLCLGRWPVDETQRARLDRALCARRAVEAIPSGFGTLLGVISLVLAASEFIRALPLILPYAVWCVVISFGMLGVYRYFKRASERRVALLRARKPSDSLSPLLVGAFALAVVAMFGIAGFSRDSLGATLVALSGAVILWIGWQIAEAPALLLGDDVEAESVIDQRLRVLRATSALITGLCPMIIYLGIEGAAQDFYRGSPVAMLCFATIALVWVLAMVIIVRATFASPPVAPAVSGRG